MIYEYHLNLDSINWDIWETLENKVTLYNNMKTTTEIKSKDFLEDKIGMDFDGVFLGTYFLFLDYLRKCGVDFNIEDYKTYDTIFTNFGKKVSERMVEVVCNTEEYYEKYKLYKGVKDFILSLKEPPILITARKDGKALLNCQRFLNQHFSGIQIFREDHFEKIKLLEKLKVKCWVDDRGDIAMQAAKAGITTFLIDCPYNKNYQHKNIIRFSHFNQLRSLI